MGRHCSYRVYRLLPPHSTSTRKIEDNKPLTKGYERNPAARHCCICARPGHQAHSCNAALRIFGQCVATTEVKSYQPVYERVWVDPGHGRDQAPRFNMFSEMSDYELNFDESFTMNESSFYNRFAKSVGLDKRKAREKVGRKKRESKKRKVEDKPMTNEDSNYSFSEFYEEKKGKDTGSGPAPDFIPLTSDQSASQAVVEVVQVPVEEPKTEAKIFLTKPHAKILLGPNGANFLKEASTKFCLNLSIAFQSVGNVLLANGCSENQDNFHNELVKYLNDASHQNEQIKQINNVPKLTSKTIIYIVEHLKLLTRSYANVKNMFQRYQHFEQQGNNAKTCDKIRRNLNIILFGQFGMREGRDHLNQLQVNLRNLKNSRNPNVSLNLNTRNEINRHIRYIFTSYDHADYADIINEYDDMRKNQKLFKIKPEDLDIPKIPCQDNHSDDSLNLSKELTLEEPSDLKPSTSDLILNTCDQLIDDIKVPKEPIIEPPLAQPFKKTKKLDLLLNECRTMVDVLNSASIKAKFDRIYDQARDGHISGANYRTVKRIHSILKSKLHHREVQVAKKKLVAGN